MIHWGAPKNIGRAPSYRQRHREAPETDKLIEAHPILKHRMGLHYHPGFFENSRFSDETYSAIFTLC